MSELLSFTPEASVFIGGDLNAHHNTWGSPRNNAAGRRLAAILPDTPGVRLLSAFEPTRIHGRCLDLAFVSTPLEAEAQWSDQFAILMSLSFAISIPLTSSASLEISTS